jgi:hypothetical protein
MDGNLIHARKKEANGNNNTVDKRYGLDKITSNM